MNYIINHEYLGVMYWAVAFIHALIFIKTGLSGKVVSDKVTAFWFTALFTILFPLVIFITLWEITASIIFFILSPTHTKYELETKSFINRVKTNITKRLTK